jgi:transposase InsO family protein
MATEGASAASRNLGISRFTLYNWRRQVWLHAEGKVSGSPVVGSDEDRAAVRDRRILAEWRAHPGLGPSQVRNQLRRQGFKVSLHTVRCVLDENGYVTPKVRREPAHDQRYEAVRPNHLWHLDFLHRYIHKQKIYILLVLDDYSRFIVGGAIWDGERVAAVQETFLAAVNRHGKPEKVMSDGGSAFYAWKGIGEFTRLLEELEADQLIATIPQVNGKLEVLNANIQKELFNKEMFFDLGETQRRLSAWIHFYNFGRTHHALGGLLVPADRYFGRADEVLAHIEAGRSPDGVGEPIPTGKRQLDLFRISSHRGQVELHLLGHRILLPLSRGVSVE